MGINIISASTLASTAATPGTGQTSEAGAGLSGFAALLSGQLAGTAGLPTAAGGLAADEKTGNTEDESLTGQAQLDPALAFIMATPAQGQSSVAKTLNTSDAGSTAVGSVMGGGEASVPTLVESAATKASDPASVFQNILGKATGQEGNGKQENPANIAADPLPQQTSAAASGTGQTTAAQNAGTVSVDTPLHQGNWSQDFSEKIVWLAKNDQKTAQININPPQLGPVQITLQMNGDQASAVFASPHAEVRQAIENSLPQLREMLSTAGINLGQADVGSNMAQQNRETPFQEANGNRFSDENAILPGSGQAGDSMASTPIQRGRGLVDLFA